MNNSKKYELIEDREDFPFRAAGRPWSKCRVQVFRNVQALSDDVRVVICTELDDNPGMSVTNAGQELAEAVVDRFDLCPHTTTFIEHYVHNRTQGKYKGFETWDNVQLVWADRSGPRGTHLIACHVDWQSITWEQVAERIGAVGRSWRDICSEDHPTNCPF